MRCIFDTTYGLRKLYLPVQCIQPHTGAVCVRMRVPVMR